MNSPLIILHKNPVPQEKCMVKIANGIPKKYVGFLAFRLIIKPDKKMVIR